MLIFVNINTQDSRLNSNLRDFKISVQPFQKIKIRDSQKVQKQLNPPKTKEETHDFFLHENTISISKIRGKRFN